MTRRLLTAAMVTVSLTACAAKPVMVVQQPAQPYWVDLLPEPVRRGETLQVDWPAYAQAGVVVAPSQTWMYGQTQGWISREEHERILREKQARQQDLQSWLESNRERTPVAVARPAPAPAPQPVATTVPHRKAKPDDLPRPFVSEGLQDWLNSTNNLRAPGGVDATFDRFTAKHTPDPVEPPKAPEPQSTERVIVEDNKEPRLIVHKMPEQPAVAMAAPKRVAKPKPKRPVIDKPATVDVVGNKVIFYFPQGVDDMSPEQHAYARKLVAQWKQGPQRIIRMSGFTSEEGTEELNKSLAKGRAFSFMPYLRGEDMLDRVVFQAKANCCFLRPNTNEWNRRMNRRLEIEIGGKFDRIALNADGSIDQDYLTGLPELAKEGVGQNKKINVHPVGSRAAIESARLAAKVINQAGLKVAIYRPRPARDPYLLIEHVTPEEST